MSEEENLPDEEYKKRLASYCTSLVDIINKSNEQFEKQLSYISGGALALSFIVIEKVLKDFQTTQYKWILITGWSTLTITLLLNLFSHKKAISTHNYTLKHIKDYLAGISDYDSDDIEKRNGKVDSINKYTLILLSLGLISLVLYTSINLYVGK